MKAVKAIEAALRIEDLWLPTEVVDVEHKGEAEALHKMRKNFLDVLSEAKKAEHDSEYKQCQTCSPNRVVIGCTCELCTG